MNIFKRIWPALVVGALWLVFLALRLAMSGGDPKEISTTPQFYEYHRPVVEEKLPTKEQRPPKKESRKVQALSAAPLPRPVQTEIPAEDKVATVQSSPLLLPTGEEPGEGGTAPSVQQTAIENSAPSVDHPAPSSVPTPAAEVSPVADAPSPAPISLDELPQAVNRTIKGAMLTIELDPPTGTARDDFLQSLGARRVSELQLWDTDIIRKYELSGQVYVFKLSGGGRILLPPTLLARIISAIETQTNGELLYRGRIQLGPQGRIVVKEAVKL